MFFEITQEAIDYLKKKDRRLGAAMDRIGPYQRKINPDLFSELIRAIVSQQISLKAAETVWGRMVAALGTISAQGLAALSVADLQAFGMSFRKAGYIHNAAEMVACGDFDIEGLAEKTDAEVVIELSKLRGIGVWTAEMLLIFSLQRQDVLSFGDLAIHRGMCKLYGHKKITRELFEKYRRRYSPHGSVAALYLWAICAEDPSGTPKAASPTTP